MESEYASFRASVVPNSGDCDEACHARYRHDVAFVLLDHVWHELLHQGEMAEEIDAKDLVKEFVRNVDDVVSTAYASIVHQN